MLVLTRKIGESIIIADDIIVTVLGINGSQTRIGVKASKNIPVHRKEIYEKIQQQKQKSKEATDDDSK